MVGIGEAWGPAKATAGYLELISHDFVGRELYDHEQIWSDHQRRTTWACRTR